MDLAGYPRDGVWMLIVWYSYFYSYACSLDWCFLEMVLLEARIFHVNTLIELQFLM